MNARGAGLIRPQGRVKGVGRDCLRRGQRHLPEIVHGVKDIGHDLLHRTALLFAADEARVVQVGADVAQALLIDLRDPHLNLDLPDVRRGGGRGGRRRCGLCRRLFRRRLLGGSGVLRVTAACKTECQSQDDDCVKLPGHHSLPPRLSLTSS